MTGEEKKRFTRPKLLVKILTPWGTLPYKGLIKLPTNWRNGSLASFRILEWTHPVYSGNDRVGMFECIRESYETRCQKVYMWKKGDSELTVTGRPENILPAEPLPKTNKTESSQNPRGPSNKRRNVHRMPVAKKVAPVNITFHTDNGHLFQRYHYREIQKTETTDINCNNNNSNGTLNKAEDIRCQNENTNNNNNNGTLKDANNNDRFESVPSTTNSAKTENSVGDWWPRKKSADLSKVVVPIVCRRHLSTKQTVIGEGAFGTVSLTSLAGVKQVVSKSFDPDFSTSKDIVREAKLLAYLGDTGVVPQIFGVCYGSDFRLSIIQEYCGKGVTLFDILYNFRKLDNQNWIKIIRQLASGMKTIHEKDILINDLKEDNILVDCESEDFDVRFIDFGLATFREGREYNVPQNERHLRAQLAPEVLDGQPTRPSSDIYSLGRMLENISYQCDIPGLSDVADACLSSVNTRPTIDRVISMIEDLRYKLTEFDSHIDF